MKATPPLSSLASLLCIMTLFPGCPTQRAHSEGDAKAGSYRRIVSFAPSITETLFALGVGGRVVGVTQYCMFPPEARRLPKVGGYIDPNFEMVMKLKPDLVLTVNQHGPLLDFLKKNAIRHEVIENDRLNDILASFSVIGALCGVKERGDSLAAAVRREVAGRGPSDACPLRVLFCAGRDNPGGGHISRVFAAGPRTFYHELIVAAGAINVCTDSIFVYPELSVEGIIRMRPEVIIDIMPSMMSSVSKEKGVADWNGIPLLTAVRSRCVFCVTGDYAAIPGPRIAVLLRDIQDIFAEAKARIGRRERYAAAGAGAARTNYAAH